MVVREPVSVVGSEEMVIIREEMEGLLEVIPMGIRARVVAVVARRQ